MVIYKLVEQSVVGMSDLYLSAFAVAAVGRRDSFSGRFQIEFLLYIHEINIKYSNMLFHKKT